MPPNTAAVFLAIAASEFISLFTFSVPDEFSLLISLQAFFHASDELIPAFLYS
ncbi:hypothetical protein ACV3V3_16560 [Clostridium perfringens]